MNRIWIASAAFALSCAEQSSNEENLPLDVLLPAEASRAGVVTRASELLTGATARGKLGDFKIYNAKVAFVIGKVADGRGYNPHGGGIIDADRVRALGEEGHSTFGEIITALDLGVLEPDEVEVVNDGSDGKAAIVRASGHEGEVPLFSVLLSSLFGAQKHEINWRTDYVLEPGAEYVKIEHALENVGRENIEFGLVMSAYLFGDGARSFLPTYGFEAPATGVQAEYYGAVADEVSYLHGDLDERLSFIITQSGISLAGSRGPIRIRPREVVKFSQVVVVGDGDLGRTQAIWRALEKGPEAQHFEGSVQTESGSPVDGAIVHALDRAPRSPERNYVSQTKVASDGTWSLDLPPGEYEFIASKVGYPPSPPQIPSAETNFKLKSPATVEYEIKDETGTLIPAKITVVAIDTADKLPSRFGTPGEPSGVLLTEYGIRGTGRFELPAGRYRLFASRGMEYEAVSEEIEIAPRDTYAFRAELDRVVDTTGWLSTDTHIHSQLSPDSPDLFPFKVKAMVVEGLELPISTEHEAIGDFNPSIEKLDLKPWINGVVGSEITTYAYGHFNAWPLVANPDLPGNGRINWYFKKPGETFAAIRANAGQPVLQVNHPRAPSIGGYFSAMGLRPADLSVARTEQWSDDFDVIEVANGCGVAGIERETMPDWFAFLDRGYRKFATGSTDSHHADVGEMGFPRTYVQMGTDDPRSASLDEFRVNTRAGRMTITCGPFVTISVGEATIGDTVPMPASGAVDVHVRVQAPSWVDADSLELVSRGGEIVKTVPIPPSAGSLRFDDTVTTTLAAGRDGWIIARVRGDTSHPVFSPRPSYAFTNPVLFDGDGDGRFGR